VSVPWCVCVGKEATRRGWRDGSVLFFFFFKIYSFIIYKYTVAVFRYTRRGHQISLQMVGSHHVVAGN